MSALQAITYTGTEIIFEEVSFSTLTPAFIFANSAAMPDSGTSHFLMVHPDIIDINTGSFTIPLQGANFPSVEVKWQHNTLVLACGCNHTGVKLCSHQAQVLYNIMERADLRIFFDEKLRQEKIKEIARHYGLENLPDSDNYFELVWLNRSVNITPRMKSLVAVGPADLQQLAEQLIPPSDEYLPQDIEKSSTRVLVFSQHKYYKHLQVGIYEAGTSAAGKIKNPLNPLEPLALAWKTSEALNVKFYSGVAAFLNNHNKTLLAADLRSLKAIAGNPEDLPVFYHDPALSESISVTSLLPVKLDILESGIELQVYFKEPFYEISGQLVIGGKIYPLNNLPLKFGYFILANHVLHLVGNMDLVRITTYFKNHNNVVLIHQSKFEEFRKNILVKLEDKIRINYSWLVTATKEQLQENGFDEPPQQIIYLSDAGQYVSINPVMRYGEAEVSILSKRQLYARDQKEKAFIVDRDETAENNFTALLLKQHPEFYGQLHQESFYLTKKQFLDDGWFLDAFDEWRAHEIKILGFNEIKNNRLNSHKVKITIKVTTGWDWFNTDLVVRYGKQKASLKQLHKSVKNRNKFVQLDDGTLGMLPAEWIKKLAAYFEAGDIEAESIRTPAIRFSEIPVLYEESMLSPEVNERINEYNTRLAKFTSIESTDSPEGLNAVLRPYQQQGLNWLNFLDDFNFGGCLADDMGLGKTIQVIAFMLLLETKRGRQTHLVVVPSSLIFNWEDELKKSAPSLKVLTIAGNIRPKNNRSFNEFDVVLASYGTVVSDIHFMKNYYFGYIFLDESQAIKNPDSQRYKAMRQLQSKNKLLVSGTPVENNTFDLYGQLSFACPGLLGNRQYFKDVYSQPIDKFGDSKRALELQQKIDPFILRRTKKQVAEELPEKTEMVIYCEMGVEQRKVYDAYEMEFRNYLLHQPEQDLPRNSMNVLQGLTKLRQICNSPSLLKDQPHYGEASAKIAVLIEQIESKHAHHKILVFSQFVSSLNLSGPN